MKKKSPWPVVSKREEKFSSIVNDIAEDMGTKRYSRKDLEQCIAWQADLLMKATHRFNGLADRMVVMAGKFTVEVLEEITKHREKP